MESYYHNSIDAVSSGLIHNLPKAV